MEFYQEGCKAYHSYVDLRSNPYQVGTNAYQLWHEGWLGEFLVDGMHDSVH